MGAGDCTEMYIGGIVCFSLSFLVNMGSPQSQEVEIASAVKAQLLLLKQSFRTYYNMLIIVYLFLHKL